MHGPKTEVILQKGTETDVAGTTSVVWSNVETIPEARIRPFSADEKLLYGRDSIITMKKCRIGYHDIAEANRQYLTAEGKILIDDDEYDIESVEHFSGPGSHYKVILRKVS
jgi:hypothetical protein